MVASLETTVLPYVTADLPGIGGALRASPEHFVVEELPLYLPQGEGQHLYVRLTKVGLTTKEVQARLERLFGLPGGGVSFAGMKDKAARTTQTFSLNVGHQPDAFAEEAVERIRSEMPVEVHWAKFHRNKLRPGHLLGNRFTVTITEPDCDVDEAQSKAEAIVAQMRKIGVPNFFGPQRFGKNGQNAAQGLALLQGDRTKKGRWLRRFLISAYQSYLCNRYLALRVEQGVFTRLLLGDIAKKYATGGLFEVSDLAQEAPRFMAHEISFTAPIFGPKMQAATGPAGELEEHVLAEAPVGMDEFAAARVEGTRRLGRLLVQECSVTQQPEEGAVTLSFNLPKGAFATTVLREIMKVDLAETLEIDEEA